MLELELELELVLELELELEPESSQPFVSEKNLLELLVYVEPTPLPHSFLKKQGSFPAKALWVAGFQKKLHLVMQ